MTADDGFRLMTVIATHRIAPRMQRLRLAGDKLTRFDTLENLHVRLYVADPTVSAFARPNLGRDGRPKLSGPTDGYAMRYYTIRDIDAAAGWIDIDFVLHEDPGPASNFARRARPGDVCGISGPCGLGVKPARRYLLAGDETALPAIARIAGSLPKESEGLILIDTHAPDGRPDFHHPAGMALRWISSRLGNEGPGFVASVSSAIAETTEAEADHFLWIAGEFSNCTALRPRLSKLRKSRYINVAYWRAPSFPEA